MWADNYYYAGIAGNQNNSQIGLSLSMKDASGNYRTGYLIGYGGGQTTMSVAAPTGGDVYLGDLNSGGGVNTSLTVRSGGNVGIGTTNPSNPLQVVGTGARMGTGTGYQLAGFFQDQSAYRGMALGFDTSGEIGVVAASSNGTPSQMAFWTANATGTWGERMRLDASGNLGIGTTSPTYKLSVKGTIGANEVLVVDTSGWADYVFSSNYRLKPLSEVATYIRQNHHLPGIPSESEVKENGISLGAMQSKLLAKIEELTLHMIEEHERNDRLEQKLQELQKQNDELKNTRNRQ
jgi:hypothetical protein